MIILNLGLSMILILFLVSKKINIGYSLIIGATVLSLLTGKNISYILNVFLKTIYEPTTISLAITISFITILGYLMDKYHILNRMVLSLEKMLRSVKLTILISPALIGTLLVTGGALMSCPVVNTLGDRLEISKDKKASINLIFRHALYFAFPLAPPLILASELGGFNILDFVKLQLPITIAMYIFGYMFFLKKLKVNKEVSKHNYLNSVLNFLLYSSPILISLIGAIVLNLPFYISLIFGIVISIIINKKDIKKDEKYRLNEHLLKTIYKGFKPSMVIAIIGIMFYKNIVNDIDEIYMYLNILLEKGMPLELLILISSALISFPLASTQPGIAILYPMILPLAPDYETKLLYGMFIYTCSFIFYYISPLHMCQVLTLEYFNVKLKDLYKNYMLILPLTFIVMLVIYFINII